MRRFITYVVLPIALIMLTVKYCNLGQYEEPSFILVDQKDLIELRDYDPIIVAEVTVQGERHQAVEEGFRTLGGYIFGGNETEQKIPMTAPVIEHPSEKIVATTPVIQLGKDGLWVVQFVMPKSYSLKTLPKPKDPHVRLTAIPARRMAIIRFNGKPDDTNQITDRTSELQAYIVLNKLKTKGAPLLAFYDPPWTLPIFRRNEVMLEVQTPGKKSGAR